MTLQQVRTVDFHTGGEPFRIVAEPPVPILGGSVAERRVYATRTDEVDRLRRVLCFEPRGHADMYGGFITASDDAGAAFGVLFWHKDGFSTACGHGTIALGVWALQTGVVQPSASGVTEVPIDVPSGRVLSRVHTNGDEVTSVDFINVASYLVARDVLVETSKGRVSVDIGFGGAMYAQLRAHDVDLSVTPDHVEDLIAIGREIKWALDATEHAQHRADDRLSGVYGTILYDELGHDASGNLHQRNVTIFANGAVDRSPCGSGTATRVAVLDARGELAEGARLVHDSIVGSRFEADVVERLRVDGVDAVIPRITGMAYKTGEHVFEIDPHDPLVPGFVLR
jgi:proline racemase